MNRCKSVAMSDFCFGKRAMSVDLLVSLFALLLCFCNYAVSLLVLRLSDLPDTLFRIRINTFTLYEKKKKEIFNQLDVPV